MLTELHIQGLRGFRSLDLDQLAPVTVLVGRNNSGKTSVLEAVECLAGGGFPPVVTDGLERRGEWGYRPAEAASEPQRRYFVDSLFHGRGLAVGQQCNIQGEHVGRGHVEARLGIHAVPAAFEGIIGHPDEIAYNGPRAALGIRFAGSGMPTEQTTEADATTRLAEENEARERTGLQSRS